jgi:phosphoribosylamine---glycine ligase
MRVPSTTAMKLASVNPEWSADAAVGVVLASGGYPGNYEKGRPIAGLERIVDPHVKVFHAGTRHDAANQVVTDGGRVLCAVGLGESVSSARDRAYRSVAQISWDGMFYRTDIGRRAVDRERQP